MLIQLANESGADSLSMAECLELLTDLIYLQPIQGQHPHHWSHLTHLHCVVYLHLAQAGGTSVILNMLHRYVLAGHVQVSDPSFRYQRLIYFVCYSCSWLVSISCLQ